MRLFIFLGLLMVNASANVLAACDEEGAVDKSVQRADVNKASKLKFISRRAHNSYVVERQKDNNDNESCVDEHHVKHGDSNAAQRLNRRFVSRRSHINYQFH